MNKWIATVAAATFAITAFAQSPNEPFQVKTPEESATLPSPGTAPATGATRADVLKARTNAAARADARKMKRAKRADKRSEKVGDKPPN